MERLRIAGAATPLGMSAWLLRKEVRAGRIPYVLIGNRYEFKVEDLDAYLDARRVPARTQATA